MSTSSPSSSFYKNNGYLSTQMEFELWIYLLVCGEIVSGVIACRKLVLALLFTNGNHGYKKWAVTNECSFFTVHF